MTIEEKEAIEEVLDEWISLYVRLCETGRGPTKMILPPTTYRDLRVSCYMDYPSVFTGTPAAELSQKIWAVMNHLDLTTTVPAEFLPAQWWDGKATQWSREKRLGEPVYFEDRAIKKARQARWGQLADTGKDEDGEPWFVKEDKEA